MADKDYKKNIEVIRAGWAPYEARVFAETAAAEAEAAKAFAGGKADEGRKILTSLSIASMERASRTALDILERLIALSIKAPVLN